MRHNGADNVLFDIVSYIIYLISKKTLAIFQAITSDNILLYSFKKYTATTSFHVFISILWNKLDATFHSESLALGCMLC